MNRNLGVLRSESHLGGRCSVLTYDTASPRLVCDETEKASPRRAGGPQHLRPGKIAIHDTRTRLLPHDRLELTGAIPGLWQTQRESD